jgi:transcription termination factor NusB
MALVALSQLLMARQERADAGTALASAQSAEQSATRAQKRAAAAESLFTIDSARYAAAAAQIHALDFTLGNAQMTVSQLEDRVLLTTTIVAAQVDDRRALDQLRAWSSAPGHRFFRRAADAYIDVMGAWKGPLELSYLEITWMPGHDPSTLPLASFESLLLQQAPRYHAHIAELVAQRKDFSRHDRLRVLLGVLKRDPSLRATYYAGKWFATLAGIDWEPFEVERLDDWWTRNEATVKD